MDKMYQERKHVQEVDDPSTEGKGKGSQQQELDYDIAKFHNFQLVRKIQLNSAYGAIGNEYFRYYSRDGMAERSLCLDS